MTTWLESTSHYGCVSLFINASPEKFGDHRPFGKEEIKLSFYHMASRDPVDRESCYIMDDSGHHKALPRQICGNRPCTRGDILLSIGYVRL